MTRPDPKFLGTVLAVGLLGVLFASGAAAQAPEAAQHAYLVVQSNQQDGTVWLDSAYAGRANAGVLAVPPGRRVVTLVPPQVDSWLTVHPRAVVDLAAGDTTTVVLDMPYVYRIASTPFEAGVFLETPEGHLELGTTPLLLRRKDPIHSALVVRKDGYRSERLVPSADLVNRLEVELTPMELDGGAGPPESWAPPRARRRWITYAAGGLALASGAVAVHYKAKADRLFDEYDRTGDPALRPDIDRYDTYSAVALGAMQVGVGVFGVRLILR